MNAFDFVENVAALKFKNTFNPYAATCPEFDMCGADQLRKALLLALVDKAAGCQVDSLWIGRDLGYRGGRRTGLALTDEVNIARHASRWDLDAAQVTIGAPVAERTAAVIWSALNDIAENVFMWNVFPFHPHEQDQPFTNRAHNRKERRVGEEILEALIAVVRPRRIVAVGNDAAVCVERIFGVDQVFKVRHPSYGGQATFLAQVRELYGISSPRVIQENLF